MKKVIVELQDNSYPIFIGKSILKHLHEMIFEKYSGKKILVVVDENVEKLHLKRIRNIFPGSSKVFFYNLKSGEKTKSYIELNKIYSFLLENNFGRDSLIIAVGGGVTGDLTAFAASTFMRGIKLIHLPTTLLAMVDSSIGGKTGINFSNKKNMIGTFYQPELVFIDSDFLSTLPKPEITSGIGEILKYAFLSDKNYFHFINKNLLKIYEYDDRVHDEVILNSVKIKAAVVTRDEKESGIRKILNLGHTFAHAFESNLNFRIKHGEAVTAGIISALCLSGKTGVLSHEKFKSFLPLLLKIKLSKRLSTFNIDDVYSIMLSDKKNREGRIKFVLVSDIGKILIDIEADKKDVYYALQKTKEILS